MSAPQSTLQLVQQALSDLDQSSRPLSEVVSKAIRVARLRDDYEALYWLRVEATTIDKEVVAEIEATIRPHLALLEFMALKRKVLTAWGKQREVTVLDEDFLPSEQKIMSLGVGEIESRIEHDKAQIASAATPQGLHPQDTYAIETVNAQVRTRALYDAQQMESVLSRIRVRVHEYLSVVEQQLMFGQTNADLFESNRRYVESRLSAIAPDVLRSMNSAYDRLKAGDVEARSHALESCRRLLKSLADSVYPPTNVPVKGSDGKVDCTPNSEPR